MSDYVYRIISSCPCRHDVSVGRISLLKFRRARHLTWPTCPSCRHADLLRIRVKRGLAMILWLGNTHHPLWTFAKNTWIFHVDRAVSYEFYEAWHASLGQLFLLLSKTFCIWLAKKKQDYVAIPPRFLVVWVRTHLIKSVFGDLFSFISIPITITWGDIFTALM